MEINTLPTELFEQIFEKITYERKCVQRANFRQIALVCKRWSAIIIPMIWKEMEITGSLRIEKSTAFSFYRHIINPNCEWGRYIQALKLHDAPFWPICMAKLLTACPYGVSAGKRDQIEIFFKKKFLSKIDVDLIIWSRTFIISKKIILSIWSLFPALTPYA